MKVDINNAREICNVVRKNFPYESPWMQANVKYKELLKDKNWVIDPALRDIRNGFFKNQDKIQELRNCYAHFENQPFKYFRELIDAVKTFEVQNCGELSRITYAILRMNGVKNCDVNLASLIAVEEREAPKGLFPAVDKLMEMFREFENPNLVRKIDHVAIQVRGNKNEEILIDSLFNECDTKEQINKIYRTKYGDVLKLADNETVNTIYYEKIPILGNDEVKELKKLYPEFIVEKKGFQTSKKNIFSFLFK